MLVNRYVLENKKYNDTASLCDSKYTKNTLSHFYVRIQNFIKREYHNPYGTAWISYSYDLLFLLFNSHFLLQMLLPVLEFLFQLQDIFKMHHVLCHNRQNHHMSFTVDSCILLIFMYVILLPVLYSKFTNEKGGGIPRLYASVTVSCCLPLAWKWSDPNPFCGLFAFNITNQTLYILL